MFRPLPATVGGLVTAAAQHTWSGAVLRMFKIVQLMAAPASLGFLAVQVCAAAPENESCKKNSLKIDELSLYTCPSSKSKYVEDSRTRLEESIYHLRHSLKPYMARFQGFYCKMMPKAEKAAEYGRESYEFLQNPPPGFYPRLGVIGFAGVVGLFLARGSKIKKIVYPLSFMGIGASLYYPQQAIAIAKITGCHLYDWSLQAYINMESLWKDSTKKKKSAKGDTEYEKTTSE